MHMNHFVSLCRCSLPIAFLQSVALSDQTPIVPATEQGTTIVGTLPDGRPSPPVSKPEPPNFSIKNSVIRKIDVVEAPEFPELPMVKGRINATVQLVDDPNLPDPPPPLPGLDISDPAVQARMAEMRSKYKDRAAQFVFVSGTVYNHSRTFLRLHLNGDPKNVISGWSNLDFNYFSGFANYQIKNQDGEIFRYSLLLSISNTDTQKENLRLSRLGKVYQVPQIPSVGELAAVGPPAF